VRSPSDLPQSPRPTTHRRRRWIIVVVVVLIALFASLKTFATFFTDALWFSSVDLHSVWLKLFEIKVGLMVVFAAIFAVLLLGSLVVAERIAPKGPSLDAEDEFVRRYQEVIGPYSRWLRAAVVVVLSLIVGSQAIGQWNNWILFESSTPFHATDPQFHRNVAYFVFTLPFEQFLVHWFFVALVLILLVTVLTHYLNGGIRMQGSRPRVRPAVKAHLSVILGVLALVKAVGYYLARFNLDLSSNGYVQGAGYTDVHARLPALELLILVSIAAAALLIYNIRRQGWALPVLGVGLWFLVALTAGTIYPAAVQALKVNPSQNTLERPYIQRNIDATRTAMGIDNVTSTPYAASTDLSAAQLSDNSDTLANVRLWDPEQTQPTYDKKQDIRSYYQFDGLALDRYKVNGVETPVVVGVREINDADLPSTSWVNTTLQYTHGYGMIISPANTATSNGDPQFAVGGVPPVSTEGLPTVTQPSVYFGLNNSGYVVANTKQPEIDFQLGNDTNVETHYAGDGGVRLANFFDRAMFALRFSDLNLIISNQITDQSRLMFDRGVQARVSKAAPFLSLDADPYPVLLNGQIDWIQDAYTTTDNYPYSQNANTSALPAASGLNKNFNYVRNSVKVLINAYTGKMTFYVMDPNDPIIQTYEKAFPGMFTPKSQMSAALKAHLRYPEDIFTVQAMTYGRYHITNAQNFYGAADAWTLSPSPGSGSPSQALQTTLTTNAQGQEVSTGQLVRMAPIYQEMQVPGQTTQSFSLLDAFVPVSQQSQIQTLSGFMIAGSDPDDYGNLQVFATPRDSPVNGPSLVAAQIDATATVSAQISLLNQNGSSALLGNVLMIPIADSLLYIQPLYVQSSRNPVPELQDVIAVYGKTVAMKSTLSGALSAVFQAPVSTTPGSSSTGELSPQVRNLLQQAQAAYQQSQVDLKAGNLGDYQADINSLESFLQEVQALTGTSTPTPTTTSTTTVPASTTTTTVKPKSDTTKSASTKASTSTTKG
jgi:uncharacterized membrane protein (UPF0182 family)